MKIWDLLFGQEMLTLRGHDSPVQGLAFSPDGHLLVSVTQDETVRIWNAAPLH